MRSPASAAASSPATHESPVGPAATSEQWLDALRAEGPERAAALIVLRGLLHEAVRFEIARRQGDVRSVAEEELSAMADDIADRALQTVLASLDAYGQTSRFLTWAYKFALRDAGIALRRRAWIQREAAAALVARPKPARTSAAAREPHDLLDAIFGCIHDVLPAPQRGVVVALAIDGVPIDVLAERLGTTRGEVYETLSDARRSLRRCLALPESSACA